MYPVAAERLFCNTPNWGEQTDLTFVNAWLEWIKSKANQFPTEAGYETTTAIQKRCKEKQDQLLFLTRSEKVNINDLIYILSNLDNHLAILAKSMALFDGDLGFKQIIEASLPKEIVENLPFLLSKITNNVQEDYQSFDQNFIERAIAEIVFKNIAGFGLWRSINKATASRQVFEEGGETCPRAFVGAVAMGWHGEVIATAYRGENINLAQHAEEILIKKIETLGKLGDVCMVASTLEPCKIRSERHRESLGHTKGCSTLLIESGIKAVVFLQNDPNGHGRGRGAENLQSHEILVLMGNDPAALHSAAVIQIYPHLQNQG